MEILHRLQATDGNFSRKIFFGDKAHFTEEKKIQRHIWSSKHPQINEEKSSGHIEFFFKYLFASFKIIVNNLN